MTPHAKIARSAPAKRPVRPFDFERINGQPVCLDLSRNWPELWTGTDGRAPMRHYVLSVGGVHEISRQTYLRLFERLKEESKCPTDT